MQLYLATISEPNGPSKCSCRNGYGRSLDNRFASLRGGVAIGPVALAPPRDAARPRAATARRPPSRPSAYPISLLACLTPKLVSLLLPAGPQGGATLYFSSSGLFLCLLSFCCLRGGGRVAALLPLPHGRGHPAPRRFPPIPSTPPPLSSPRPSACRLRPFLAQTAAMAHAPAADTTALPPSRPPPTVGAYPPPLPVAAAEAARPRPPAAAVADRSAHAARAARRALPVIGRGGVGGGGTSGGSVGCSGGIDRRGVAVCGRVPPPSGSAAADPRRPLCAAAC